MTVNELRAMRAKAWESAKNFLDSHRNENGMLSLEDTKTYEEMEAKIVNLGKEIERQEKMDAMEREIIRICETKPYSKDACLAKAREFDKNDKFREYIELYEVLNGEKQSS